MSQKISDEDLMDFADQNYEFLSAERMAEIRKEVNTDPALKERVENFEASGLLISLLREFYNQERKE